MYFNNSNIKKRERNQYIYGGGERERERKVVVTAIHTHIYNLSIFPTLFVRMQKPTHPSSLYLKSRYIPR
jgi:hypothetical protein